MAFPEQESAAPPRNGSTIQLSRLAPWVGGVVVLIVVLVVYGPMCVELVRDWGRDSNYSHGFLIPVISGYLIWKKRKELRDGIALSPSTWVLGLFGILAAGAAFVLGTAGAEVFTQRVSLVLLLGSLVLFLMGWRSLRLTAFPIGLLLLAIPLPYVIYYGLTGPMQTFAAKVGVLGLQQIGIPTVREGNIIHLSQSSMEVAEACSGIRSLYAFLTLGALLAYTTMVPWWARLLLFLSTIPLSVAGNAVRVFGTGVAVHVAGPEMLEGTVHEMFGLLVIGVSMIFLLLIKKVVRSVWPSDSSSSS